MRCISSAIYAQSSEGHIGFRSGDLPFRLIATCFYLFIIIIIIFFF